MTELSNKKEQRLKEKKKIILKKKKARKTEIIIGIISSVVLCAVIIFLVFFSTPQYTAIKLGTLLKSSASTSSALSDLSDDIMTLNGEKVEVNGYLIANDEYYFISKSETATSPFSSCKYSDNNIPVLYKDGTAISSTLSGYVTIKGTLYIGSTTLASGEVVGMVIYVDSIKENS